MLRNTLQILAIIGVLAGLYAAAVVSFDTITGQKPCPVIVSMPACYIVFSGYLWMLVTVLLPKLKTFIFLIGWLPVFMLAAAASVLEITTTNICPQSEAGIALCFISLGLCVSVLIAFLLSKRLAY